MQIFILDFNPIICAQYHCDKHVIKQILESAQLLCTAHWMNESEAPYKATHKNHPCCVWARESIQNYKWLSELGLELCKEYTKRYNKIHKTQSVLEWCAENIPNLSDKGITPFALAMPVELKIENNTIESYRNYYKHSKSSFATWKTNTPYWW